MPHRKGRDLFLGKAGASGAGVTLPSPCDREIPPEQSEPPLHPPCPDVVAWELFYSEAGPQKLDPFNVLDNTWPLAKKQVFPHVYGKVVCSESSLFWHGLNLAVDKYSFHKGPFLQWPPQLWIEIALLSKHLLTTTQIYRCKEMYVHMLLSHCPRMCASQSMCWYDRFCGLKRW